MDGRMDSKSMVVNCVAYKAGQRLGEVTIDDISEVVKQPDTFVWLGLRQPEPAFMRKVQEGSATRSWRSKTRCAHQRPSWRPTAIRCSCGQNRAVGRARRNRIR